MRAPFAWHLFAVVLAAVANSVVLTPVQAQVRGVYPVGMTATNSGVTPEAGITYSNLFIFFSRDEEKGSHGEILATGQNSVIMDLNSFVWVSKKTIALLGGAVFSAAATLPIANNSLTSDVNGALSGGGGFADSYYQPFILGWRKQRFAIRAIYGFLAPTGRFSVGANTNVGSGYWTSAVASGQTVYLDRNKATALSAFQMYEFHGTQEGTMIHPGETFNLDYSLTHTFPLQRSLRLQLGLVGYGEWQTTDKHGPNITLEQAAAHYKVNALGFTANAVLPEKKVNVGLKYFREFECRSTFQGYTLQISAAITF
ncbi:MAG: transporter [Candidatus Sulfotelmatobacter sp.]